MNMSTESLSNLDSNLVIIVAWNFFHSWHSFIKDKHTDVKIVLLSCIFETVYARQLFFIFFPHVCFGIFPGYPEIRSTCAWIWKNNETNKDQRFIGKKYARIVKVHSITLWKKNILETKTGNSVNDFLVLRYGADISMSVALVWRLQRALWFTTRYTNYMLVITTISWEVIR